MKPISLEESKKIEFDILCYFADFCDKHGLEYGLGFGTLLGAIRHKGFIPWDDDIDVVMNRNDYNKLIEIFNREKDEESPYYLVSPYDKGGVHSFVKVIDTRTIKREDGYTYKHLELGIDIDVFPVDGVPTDEKEFYLFYKKLVSVYTKFNILKESYHNKPINNLKLFVKKALILLSCGSPKRLLKKAEKLHAQYPYESSEFVRTIEGPYAEKGGKVEKTSYEGTVLVDFEGRKFKAPKGYHEILTSIYGDYMQLPPIEQRITHHLNQTYWK